MYLRHFGAALVAAFVSGPAFAGVVVGHPVEIQFASGTGLYYTSGDISIEDEIVNFCNSTQDVIEIDETFDLFDSTPDYIGLPQGTICSVELTISDPTHLVGGGSSGGAFSLTLHHVVIDIDLEDPIVVASDDSASVDTLELAFPDWITATYLNLSTGVTRTIDTGHPLHDSIRNKVKFESTIH